MDEPFALSSGLESNQQTRKKNGPSRKPPAKDPGATSGQAAKLLNRTCQLQLVMQTSKTRIFIRCQRGFPLLPEEQRDSGPAIFFLTANCRTQPGPIWSPEWEPMERKPGCPVHWPHANGAAPEGTWLPIFHFCKPPE